MRQLRYVDFDCPSCGAACTRFVYFDTDRDVVDDGEQKCDNNLSADMADRNTGEMHHINMVCGGVIIPREMSGVGYMKTITKGNADFSDRERERLEKRSDEHWRKKGRDEGIDRERALFKKHGAVGGVR